MEGNAKQNYIMKKKQDYLDDQALKKHKISKHDEWAKQ